VPSTWAIYSASNNSGNTGLRSVRTDLYQQKSDVGKSGFLTSHIYTGQEGTMTVYLVCDLSTVYGKSWEMIGRIRVTYKMSMGLDT